MKNPLSFCLGLAAAALVSATWLASAPLAQSAPQAPSGDTAGADDPATGLFSQMCSDCHEPDRIVSTRRTKADWEDIVQKMIEKGATGSGKDFETVFGYLLRHYGKVYVNNATPEDLATIAGLSQKDADAIVAYRKASGPFADLAAVEKVPNIDVKTLEAHKDAVAF